MSSRNPEEDRPGGASASDPGIDFGGTETSPSIVESVLDELKGSPVDQVEPSFPGYRVLGKLGQGSFGAVYRARDEKLGREVAIKVLLPHASLDEASRARFLAEARNLARIRHPNVLMIHAVLENEGRIALVTELIDGQPLSELVRDAGPWSAVEAAAIGIELCRALAAVHQAGLVHRDVKTANILRERGGRIILADFGLGVFLAEGEAPARRGALAGSPLFMSPEQSRGEPVDARTDLYAAGVVLYHLATGKYPLTARDLDELFEKIQAGQLTPIRDLRPDVPEGFAQVARKAVSTRPAQRYQSAGEMEEALLRFLGAASASEAALTPRVGLRSPTPNAEQRSAVQPSSERPGSARPGRPRAAVRPVWLALFVAALAGASLLTAMFFLQGPTEPLVTEARFELAGAGGPRPLAGGEVLPVGSKVDLQYRAARPSYLYVLNESSRGERYVLFPIPGGELQNPLPAATRLRVPGAAGGKEVWWELDTPAEEERLFVIASPKRVEDLERLVRETPSPAPGKPPAYPAIDRAEVSGLLRGFGRLASSPEPGGAAGAAAAGAGSLARAVEELERSAASEGPAAGLWIHKLTLRGETR